MRYISGTKGVSDTDIVLVSDEEKINALLEKSVKLFLEAAAISVEQAAKDNTAVKSGSTKNAWGHELDKEKFCAVVGNSTKNAVWEEYGTGEYALGGNGRKGGWVYKDEEGFHHTYGKPPKRPLFNAFCQRRSDIEDTAKIIFREVFL